MVLGGTPQISKINDVRPTHAAATSSTPRHGASLPAVGGMAALVFDTILEWTPGERSYCELLGKLPSGGVERLFGVHRCCCRGGRAWPVKCRPMARPGSWGPAMPPSVQPCVLTRRLWSGCLAASASTWGWECWLLHWARPAQVAMSSDQRAAVMAATKPCSETETRRGSRLLQWVFMLSVSILHAADLVS